MRRDNAAVRALVAKGATSTRAQGDGMTALHWAAKHGDVDIDDAAAQREGQPKAVDAHRRLHAAARRERSGQRPVVAALLKAGADPTADHDDGSDAAAPRGVVGECRPLVTALARSRQRTSMRWSRNGDRRR